MSWFPLYLIALVFLRIWATSKDSRTLTILLTAGVCSTLLAHLVMPEIHAAWKLAIPGAVETLTIMALVTTAPHNRTTLGQVVLLLIAWWCHLQCYADIQLNTDVVYDHYEQILAGVAVGQLLGFHDTVFSIGRSVQRWAHVWASGGGFVSAASRGAVMVRSADQADTQNPLYQCPKT